MSHKIGQSYFDGLRDVVLRHRPEPGSAEVSGATFTHRLEDGGRVYSIDNAIIGNRRYGVVAVEGGGNQGFLRITSRAYGEDIYIEDSDGNGIVDDGDVVAVCSDNVCGPITPPEEQGVYDFVQHDLLAGIVEDPGLSGFSLFMEPPTEDDTADGQLRRLMPSMYRYVSETLALAQKMSSDGKAHGFVKKMLSGGSYAYVGVEPTFDADSFSFYLLPILKPPDDLPDISECGRLFWLCSAARGIGISLDESFMSRKMVTGYSAEIRINADGEISYVSYPTYLPDGRLISRVFLKEDDGLLKYSNGIMVNPRLPSPDEIGDDDGLRHEVVTVMDPSGVDWGHPVLAPMLAWNYADPPDGFDNDSNGFKDDFLGWDFRDDDNIPFDYITDIDTEIEFRRDTTVPNPFSHGTSVAHIASDGNASARILPVSVWGRSSMWAMGAIMYAKGAGSRIVNMSFGDEDGFCGHFSALGDEIENNRDMLFVASAGNERGLNLDSDKRRRCRVNDPHDNLLTVAAIDEDGDLADFSNFGYKSVELAAPGVDIYSIVARVGSDEDRDEMWYLVSGTSLSSPAVANAAAAIWQAAPHLDVQQVVRILENTSRREEPLRWKVSWGVLDDVAAARHAKGMVDLEAYVPPCSNMFSDRSTLSLYQFLTECLL